MASAFPGRRFFLNGTSKDLNVDGSTVPMDFFVMPPVNQTWEFYALNMVITGPGNISAVKTGFFTLPNLTVGIDTELKKSGVTVTNTAFIRSNADLLDLFGTDFLGKIIGNSNVSFGSVLYYQPVILNGAFGDHFRVRINDNLSSLEMFTLSLQGTLITN